MIRWCAYCQRFLGESAPYDRFEVTHGICGDCQRKGAFDDGHLVDRMAPVRAFYGRVTSLEPQSRGALSPLVDEGLGLGLDPIDLMMGIIQPALYQVGHRWAQGEATVADEHGFTAHCTHLLRLLTERLAARMPVGPPQALLVNADGNYHTLGLEIVEAVLAARGVRTRTVTPGLPGREVVRLVRLLRPRVLGMSVALERQLAAVRQVAVQLCELPEGERPALFVGGYLVKSGLRIAPDVGFSICADPRELAAIAAAA